MSMVGQLVRVLWSDAWFDFEHGKEEETRRDYPVETIGFLIRDEDGVLSVAQEKLPERDGYRAVTHIPRAVVRSIHPLQDGNLVVFHHEPPPVPGEIETTVSARRSSP